jgi:hypothetical protein
MYEAFDGKAPRVQLFRIGGTGASLVGIGGAREAGPISVTTRERRTDAGSLYKATFLEGVLYVWRVDSSSSGTLVYQADMSGTYPVVDTDMNELYVEKDGAIDETPNEFGGATYATGVLFTGVNGEDANVTFTEGTNGTDMTRRELYEALDAAYAVLEDSNLHFIHPMDVYLDDFNVADIPEGSAPVDPEEYYGTDDYLGYVKREEVDGAWAYTWADTKVDDDYHEVNFAYQLANFCHQMTRNELMVHGTINVLPPTNSDPTSVRAWVGKVPTYNELDETIIAANGEGLLGNKFMSGTTDMDPGFWATEDEWLDSPDIEQDRNGIDVDLGKYLSVVAIWGYVSNAYGRALNSRSPAYLTGGGATYAGFLASLPPNQAPTFKLWPIVMDIKFTIAKSKLNDLAGARYIVLRPTPGGWRVADGPTAALSTSDWRRFTTFNIMKFVDREIRALAEEYVGVGMTLLRRESLKSRLELRAKDWIKDEIIQSATFVVTATSIEAANGDLYIFSDVVPAFETRHIYNIMSVKRQ